VEVCEVKRILVTGGSGFIGSALVKALLRDGNRVRVLDNNWRGAARRLNEVEKDIEFIEGDIRDAEAVASAVRGCDEVHHLAFVNGTRFFYTAPELVLEVGVKGIVNVLDACRRTSVSTIVLASSSEVLFSWHIAGELAAKLRQKGYRGTLLMPLPVPRPL
jgi:nucleoside-diphosphate-sugar epimerase